MEINNNRGYRNQHIRGKDLGVLIIIFASGAWFLRAPTFSSNPSEVEPLPQVRGCQMISSPKGWLRILLPLNMSTVVAGSSLVFRDGRAPESKGDIRVSINGRTLLWVPARLRAMHVPLPLSLPLGQHFIHLRAVDHADQHAGDDEMPLDDPPGEDACVWVIIANGTRSETSSTDPTRAALEIMHPLGGSWFSSEPVLCPPTAVSKLERVGTSSHTAVCGAQVLSSLTVLVQTYKY